MTELACLDGPATAAGWYGSLREAVGPDAAGHWLKGQLAVVWIAERMVLGAELGSGHG